MDIQISEWGNSLGMRIPKSLSKQLGLRKGSRLRVDVKRGKLILSPVDDDGLELLREWASDIDLEKLVRRITPKNRQVLSDWMDAAPVGKEVW